MRCDRKKLHEKPLKSPSPDQVRTRQISPTTAPLHACKNFLNQAYKNLNIPQAYRDSNHPDYRLTKMEDYVRRQELKLQQLEGIQKQYHSQLEENTRLKETVDRLRYEYQSLQNPQRQWVQPSLKQKNQTALKEGQQLQRRKFGKINGKTKDHIDLWGYNIQDPIIQEFREYCKAQMNSVLMRFQQQMDEKLQKQVTLVTKLERQQKQIEFLNSDRKKQRLAKTSYKYFEKPRMLTPNKFKDNRGYSFCQESLSRRTLDRSDGWSKTKDQFGIQREQLKCNNQQLQIKNNQLKSQKQQLIIEIGQLKNQHYRFNNENNEVKRENYQLIREISRSKSEKYQLSNQVYQLQNQRYQCSNQLDQLNNMKNHLSNEIGKLSKQKHQLIYEIDKLKTDKAYGDQQTEQPLLINDQPSSNKNNKLQSHNYRLKNANEQIINQNRKIRDQAHQLKSTLRNNQITLDNIREQLKIYQQSLSQKQQEITKANQQIAIQRNKNQQLQKQIYIYKNKIVEALLNEVQKQQLYYYQKNNSLEETVQKIKTQYSAMMEQYIYLLGTLTAIIRNISPNQTHKHLQTTLKTKNSIRDQIDLICTQGNLIVNSIKNAYEENCILKNRLLAAEKQIRNNKAQQSQNKCCSGKQSKKLFELTRKMKQHSESVKMFL